MVEHLWEDLVENLPEGAHVVVTMHHHVKRARWNGTAWQELTGSF